jgi:sulfatase maturation enzyme AslB (radical SAM superfamily)
MSNLPEHFCILPWINQEARTNGEIGVCCVMQETVPDMNLADGATLKDAWDSKWLADLKTDFLAGEKPKACYNCWNEEKAGIDSKRLRELRKFPHHLEDLTHLKPKSMDLKLGNICNTKCRICTGFASSQWVPEEIERDGDTNQFAQLMGRLGRWPELNEQFWDDLESQIEEVESLEFFGGEPFLIKRHFDILQTLADKGRAKDISLSYNTNGSIFPEQHIDLLSQFKDVQVFFSIDGVGERFNYIRHPQQFEDVIENYNKFRSVPSIRTNIFYTVSLFNIMYMDELLEYQKENDLETEIHFNMVYVPHHISPKALPQSAKTAITEKFKHHTDHRIQSTLNFMNQEDYDGYLDEFVRQVTFSDKYRCESIAETFPELYEYLRPWFEQ